MNIPQLDSCRFISLTQLRDRIKTDTFTYKSVRVAGKIVNLQNDKGFTLIRQPDWQNMGDQNDSGEDCEFQVNTFFVRDRTLEVGKVYEFLGEIEEVRRILVYLSVFVQNEGGIIVLKARVVKQLDNFHPKVYQETASDM